MNGIGQTGVSVLTLQEASLVMGGECDCAAHCAGRAIGKAINFFFTKWPGMVTYDWTNK